MGGTVFRVVTTVAVASVVGSAVLTACGSEEGDGDGLTVWTTENQTERVRAIQAIADRFTEQTGTPVEIVGIDDNQFSQLITSAGAAGDLPDVLGAMSLANVWQMASNDLINTEAAEQIVAELGEETFTPRALELTRDDDTQLAVPSDGWAQLLLYRRDLFEAGNLPAPDSLEAIERAARTLHGDGRVGIVVSTVPDDVFTVQTFEAMALANGCQMVDDDDGVVLDSPECVEVFDFYRRLATDYGPAGAQNVDSTRATYFSGQAAMVVWSSFILDELAGLRNDALPNCPECAEDPTFLARNSGVVTTLTGPRNDEPVQFGEITSWVVTRTAPAEEAMEFVRFMMEEGYVDWLDVTPEGKVPVREGTPDNPTEFVDAWHELPAGVDTQRPLAELYTPDVIEALSSSPETFSRWGFPQGEGELVGATLGELPVAQAISAMTAGDVDAAEAAARAAEDIRSIQASLE